MAHKNQLYFVANWKMNMPYDRAVSFCKDNVDQLETLQKNQHATLVVCPSFESLSSLYALLKPINISIGAQNCSWHEKGAYTGEVAAQSLKQVGCSYAIVGHSERRNYFDETNEIVLQKVKELIKADTIPIICIGETIEEHQANETHAILEKQLSLTLDYLCEGSSSFLIAYEPVWAIGSGKVPDNAYLSNIFSWLNEKIASVIKNKDRFSLLYGGSVDETNASKLIQIEGIDGFLIGGASTDFQKYQKIVLLSIETNFSTY